MAGKSEKERRKEILNDLRQTAKEEFNKNLPTIRQNFMNLFDYLDKKLKSKECNDTNDLTKQYFQEIGVENIDEILNWLADKGGYCDCEILANVEQDFE